MLYENSSKATLAGELLFIEPSIVDAQVGSQHLSPVLVDTPQFILSLITGVLLAIVLHVLLTTFTLATRTSLVSSPDVPAESGQQAEERKHAARMGAKIGICTICTVWASLLLASLLAIKLSLVATHALGLMLGLVIWAVFFTVICLAMKSSSSLADTHSTAVLRSCRALLRRVKGLVNLSQVKVKAAPASDPSSVQALDYEQIDTQIGQYLDSLVVPEPDYNLIRCELSNLLNDTLVGVPSAKPEMLFDQHAFIQLAEQQPHLSKQHIRQLVGLFNEVKQAMSSPTASCAVTAEVKQCIPTLQDDKRQVKKADACYRLNTGKESLNPNSIRQDIESIIKGPLDGKELAGQAASDQLSLFALLAQRAAVTEEDTEQAYTYLEKTFDSIRQRFMVPTSAEKENRVACSNSYERPTAFDCKAIPIYSQDELLAMDRFRRKLRHLLASVAPAELNYTGIQLRFEQLFSAGCATSGGWEKLLQQYNRTCLEALVAHRDAISSSAKLHIVAAMEGALGAVSRRVANTKNQIKYRVAQAEVTPWCEVKPAKRVTAPVKGLGLLSLTIKWTKHTRIG